MMEILAGSDNFFKYLVTIGIGLVFVGLVYPLRKEQKLRLDQLEIQHKERMLEIEVEEFQKQPAILTKLKTDIQAELDSIGEIRKRVAPKDRVAILKREDELMRQFDDAKAKFHNFSEKLKIENCNLEFEKARNAELSAQINQYWWFNFVFIVVGGMAFLSGIIFWMNSTYIEEQKKLEEAPAEHTNFFAKTGEWLARNLWRRR